ncbi:MAG: hypothetical protein ACKVWV_15230 [Planctomycetota bacterium]
MRSILFGLLALLLLLGLAGLWFTIEPAPVAASGSLDPTAAERATQAALIASEPEAALRARAVAIEPASALATADARPAASLPPRARVTGRVVDLSGAGVGRATVLGSTRFGLRLPLDLEPELLPKGWVDRVESTADVDGRFVLESLDPGPLQLAVRAHGFAPRDLSLPEIGAAAFDVGSIVLTPGVTLRGVVVDERDRAVPGASVYAGLWDDGTRGELSIQGLGVLLARTDANGEFTVDTLAHGPWRLFVESSAHAVTQIEGRTERPGESVDGLRIALRDGGEIEGRVEASAMPAGGFEVRASPLADAGATDAAETAGAPSAGLARPRRTHTRDDGSFTLRGIETHVTYRLSVWEPAGAARPPKLAWRFESVVATRGERGKVLRERPQTTVAFRAVDARTNAPVEELVAWAGIGRERVVSDESGVPRHHFDGGVVRTLDLRPPASGGPLWLRVRAPGYAELVRRDLEIALGRASDVGVLRLEPEPTLRVRVVDAASGAPVADASVFVGEASPEQLSDYQNLDPQDDYHGDRSVAFARTDAGGFARVAAGAGRTVDARATARGYLSAVERATVPLAGDDASVEVRLPRGGRVDVRVRDEHGAVVPRVGVVHVERAAMSADGDGDDDEGDLGAERSTDALGVARFPSLPVGAHEFRLHGEASDWRSIDVAEGGDYALEFVVPARAMLEGTIREAAQPLAGAIVRLVPARESEDDELEGSRASTDLDGRFEIDGVAPGAYELWVGHRRRAMATRVTVEIAAPRTTCRVDLPAASIEGRVVDEHEQPLAGVRVRVEPVDEADARASGGGLFQTLLVADENGMARVRHRAVGDARAETAADGRYRLRGVAADVPMRVRAERDDLESVVTADFSLSADEARSGVDFVLRGAGAIDIAVAAPPADSRADPSFGAGDADQLLVRIVLAADGGATESRSIRWNRWQRRQVVRSLLPGAYDVQLVRSSNPADVIAEQRVTVRVGETARAAFSAP